MTPVRYGFTIYQSELEATWAAFFDRLGWRYQYRPVFEHGQPDFFIFGASSMLATVVGLPEVLPLAAKLPTPADGGDNHLLLGTGPIDRRDAGCGTRVVSIGSFLGWGDDAVLIKPSGYGVCSDTHSYRCRVTDHYDGSLPSLGQLDVEEAFAFWREAMEEIRRQVDG
ncbi:MAG: hypothetical protein ACO1SV_12415 [Fimbriimonas sp.]